MEKVTIITPTGGRPECFDLLTRYVNRQETDRHIVWVIVDDCKPRTPCPRVTEGITPLVINPDWVWDGMNTQAASLSEALSVIPDDSVVLIMEDDDWYSPQYVERMAKALEGADLVGEVPSVYYHVSGLAKTMGTPETGHCSLGATGMKGAALQRFRKICSTHDRRIDQRLWGAFKGKKRQLPQGHNVGIKGMPGRYGIGIGHKPRGKPMQLRDLIGADADYYSPYILDYRLRNG